MKSTAFDVRAFRVEHDLSQAEFCELLARAGAPTPVSSVKSWEQGHRPTPPWVGALVARLKKAEIREIPRQPRERRPIGKSTPHAK